MNHYSKEVINGAKNTLPNTCFNCHGDIIFDDKCLVITCIGECASIFEYNRYYYLDDSVYYWEEFIEDDYIDDNIGEI